MSLNKDSLEEWFNAYNVFEVASESLIKFIPESNIEAKGKIAKLFKEIIDIAGEEKLLGIELQKLAEQNQYINHSGENIPLVRAFGSVDVGINNMAKKITEISTKSLSMITGLEEAINNLADINDFIVNIQKVTKQAHLLSLNANIEAVIAGEMGKGFAVVANEVKSLSKEITSLTKAIKDKIELTSDGVKKSYKDLSEIAKIDISEDVVGKEKLTELMSSMQSQGQEINEFLKTQSTKNIINAQTISSLINDSKWNGDDDIIVNIINIAEQELSNRTQVIKEEYIDEALGAGANLLLAKKIINSLKDSSLKKIFIEKLLEKKYILNVNELDSSEEK